MSDETRTVTDPYQWLHDNEFSWDDVNAIAAILDHGGFRIIQAAALPTSTEGLAKALYEVMSRGNADRYADTYPSTEWEDIGEGAAVAWQEDADAIAARLASLSPSPTETPETCGGCVGHVGRPHNQFDCTRCTCIWRMGVDVSRPTETPEPTEKEPQS